MQCFWLLKVFFPGMLVVDESGCNPGTYMLHEGIPATSHHAGQGW